MASLASLTLLLVVAAVSLSGVAGSKPTLNISNNCSYTVWPGILSGPAGSTAALDGTGFELAPGESRTLLVPTGWAGRVWGRTLCSSTTDSSGSKFTCVTGDCGSGKQDCAGGGPAPPATLAQFTLDGIGGMDFYDVSLVDGFNLPMLVAPQAGAAARGKCAPAGCSVDLNGGCPAELRVTSGTGDTAVACKSACQAFGSPKYCCTGEFGAPDTCKPSAYSELFKHTCPRAFSYAYDSAASTFTCGGGDTAAYTITFCPSTSSGAKPSSPNSQPPPPPGAGGDLPHIDVTVVVGNSTGGGGGGNEFPAWGVVAGALSVLAVVLGAIFGCFRHIMKRRAQGAASTAGEK